MFNKSITTTTIENIKSSTQAKGLFLFILILMSTAGLVGSDVYLPTLPEMTLVLNQTSHAMQLTLSIYLLGLSFGQLLFGPLTDRFGRKNLLIIGMVIYFIASLSCAFSTNYIQLLVSRFVQAVGACSGLIIGRAIVGDLFDAKEASKVFTTIFPFVGMSPAISPVLGGLIAYYFNWHATFYFVGLFACCTAILIFYYIPETLLKENRKPLNFIIIFSTYPNLLFNYKFIAYALAPCTAYIAYFAYIAQSPFIFYSYGYGERAIGVFYITLSITYVFGNLLGRRLLHRYELNDVLKFGFLIFNLGGFVLLLAGFFAWSLAMMVLSISVLTFGNGLLIPLGTAGVISSFSKSTGYASGLLGCIQLGVAALTAALIGFFEQHSVLYLGLYIFIVTIVGSGLFYYLNYHNHLSNNVIR